MTVLEELKERGGVIEDCHFVYKSGKHGTAYVNIDAVLSDVWFMWNLAQDLMDAFRSEVYDVVVAPATGGIVLGHFTALARMQRGGPDVSAVWADKQNEGFVIERQGFTRQLNGHRVLVVDDIMTNANERGSVYKLCRLVEAAGGVVVGVGLICNRCGGTAEDLGVPLLKQLSEVSFEALEREDCEATGPCSRGVQIVNNIGHGAEFQEENPHYEGGYISVLL